MTRLNINPSFPSINSTCTVAQLRHLTILMVSCRRGRHEGLLEVNIVNDSSEGMRDYKNCHCRMERHILVGAFPYKKLCVVNYNKNVSLDFDMIFLYFSI